MVIFLAFLSVSKLTSYFAVHRARSRSYHRWVHCRLLIRLALGILGPSNLLPSVLDYGLRFLARDLCPSLIGTKSKENEEG